VTQWARHTLWNRVAQHENAIPPMIAQLSDRNYQIHGVAANINQIAKAINTKAKAGLDKTDIKKLGELLALRETLLSMLHDFDEKAREILNLDY
jgi:hypothetical protein